MVNNLSNNNYELNAKRKMVCRSCIMVEEQDHLNEFYKLGAKYLYTFTNGAIVVEIPLEKVEEFVKLSCQLMKPGYWNEYLGPKTGFFFKLMSGEVLHYTVIPENYLLTNQTFRKFIPNWDLNTNLWKWLADVEIYKGWIKS